jgi:hypothetical protein
LLLRRRMRNPALALAALLALALAPAPAGAAPRPWQGTLALDFAHPALPTLALTGAGVADAQGDVHLSVLRLGGGIAGQDVGIVSAPSIPSVVSVSASLSLGSGTLAPFSPIAPAGSPQLSRAALPVRGALRLCLVFVGCSSALTLALTESGGAQGLGVGGLLTLGGAGPLRISAEAAPWTARTASLPLATPGGSTLVLTTAGFVHGPISFTSSTALPGGQLSLVTPLAVSSEQGQAFASFARLDVRFVPEPAAGPALALGCALLTLLGRRRMRR